MINELAPILFVLGGVVLLLIAARLARRIGLPEGIGSGVALWITAIAALLVLSRRPAWLAVGATEDRLLSYARIVGLTGLLFLAGTRFDLTAIRNAGGYLVRIALAGAVVFAGAIVLFGSFGRQESASVVLLAATIVASSVWYCAAKKSDSSSADHWRFGAVVLSAIAVAAVYFFDIFHAIPRSRATATAYVVVALYESLKLVLLFAFGYFTCSRFLARAAGRVSKIRSTIGFALIAILIFGLAFIVTNQLVAVAWAFVAGALWRTSSIGEAFSEIEKPVASAILISFAFLSPLLQLHGRGLSAVTALPILMLMALLVKAVLVGFGTRAQGAAWAENAKRAITMSLPGEIAILLLGFGVTRWAIDPSVYFSVLGYALLSTLVTPATWHFLTKKTRPAKQVRSKTMRNHLRTIAGLLISVGTLVLFSASSISAQQPATNQSVQLGRGMSVLAPGLMEIGAKTNLFLTLADKIALTAEQKRKLEDLLFDVQMYTFQKETDLDVADAEMKRLMTRDNIDLDAVRAKMKEFEEVRVEASMKKIETLLKAINLLTHEQHTKIILLAREPEQTTKPSVQTF